MTRWLVTGAAGMLAQDLVAALAGRDVVAATRARLDITDADAVAAAVADVDVVVNAAAWNDVDGAETREAAAMAANADGPRVLARACRRKGARLLHVSTDYVFGGELAPGTDPAGAEAWPEDAVPTPRTAYGRSKLAGERAVLEDGPEDTYVVRTAWLYGEHGRNFVRTMIELERSRPEIDVVDDQWGQPTWTRDLATRLVALGEGAAPAGIYHVTGAGRTTWCGLARAVFAGVGADTARVRGIPTAEFPRPAPRPTFSVLAHDRLAAAGLAPMAQWEDSLRAALPLIINGSTEGDRP